MCKVVDNQDQKENGSGTREKFWSVSWRGLEPDESPIFERISATNRVSVLT